MHFKFHFFLIPCLLLTTFLSAQVPKDAAIPVTATFTSNPPSVTISWPNSAASEIVVMRHTKSAPPATWTSLLNVAGSTQATLVDNLVSTGQVYEYVVQRTIGGVTSYGYAHVALNAPVVDGRGKLIFLVDSLLMGPLGNEIGQLKLDMMGEGWIIVPHIIGSGATVQSIKNQIVADYSADAFNTKMVFLLGALPVPYSGNTAWDLHTPDHQGAWPSDSYYGDVNGVWTDLAVNNTIATRAANDNVPGDKKFDQNVIPTAVELAVGRVDFRHLTPATFGTSQVELYRRYLNKDHAWRTKAHTVANKAIVDDNSGYANGEAFAANGFRNAYPLVGAANVVEGDFLAANPDGYLLGFGAGTGTYTSAAGVGTSADFATNTVNTTFSMFYGDYFGDWDSETDPFLPSALASNGSLLTTTWAGRPHVFYEGLASGETVGYCLKETQNAQYNAGFLPSYGESGTHVSLLGDPTLRANVVAPPTNLTATGQCGTVTLHWTAPAGGAPLGYHIYRGPERNGFYDRLTEVPWEGTTFADNSAPDDTIFYQVRAIEKVTTPGGGSYFNSSTGASVFLIFHPSGVPVVELTGGTLTCATTSVTLGGVVAPNTATWTGPQGFTSAQSNPAVSLPGVYAATVTGSNGCTTVSEVAVLIDTILPTFAIPAIPPLTCATPCGILTMPETPGYQVTLDGTLLITGVTYTLCDTGLHTVIIHSLNNGCDDTYTAFVHQDFTPPGATATSNAASCGGPFQLQANSPTAGVTYAWNGPDEYFSTEQSPTVTVLGTYQLIVRNPATGCTSTASVVINGSGGPNVSATGAALGCLSTTTIHGNSTTTGVTFSWTGPNGFTSNLQNPTVTLAGTYVLTVSATGGCTSTASVVVSQDNTPPNATATGAAIACGQQSAIIQGNSTTSGATFAWTGPNNFTSNLQNPTVNAAGTYVLTVSAPNGCTSTASAVVTADATVPNASAVGATINCSHLTVTIQGNSTTTGAIFGWTGPGGFTSTLQDPTVSAAGTYLLTVTAPGGCTSTASAIVNSDTAVPNATATGFTLTCTSPGTENPIQGNSTTPNVTYSWTGPNGFTSNQKNPPATMPGTYVLTVTAPNGCTSSATAVLNADINIPTASATGTALTCSQPTGTIQGNSTTTGVTFTWTGPGGFTSTQQNPTVTLAGTYVLTVASPNGCTSTASVEVTTNQVLPNATALGATLTCLQPTAIIQGNSTTTGATFAWTGPNGFTSNQQNTTVTLAGTYVLTVTAPNGCASTATALVGGDTTLPNATAGDANLTCNQPTTPLPGNSTTPGVTFAWTGPNGFTSSQQNPVVSVAGTYVLKVTAPNGCTNTAIATITTSITLPNVIATGTVLTCNQPTGTIQGTSFTSGSSFVWTGPGGFTSTEANPTVSLPGTYLLTVTAANSCSNTATAIVTVDSTVPNITAIGTTLTCNQPSSTIQGNSTTPGATYVWTGPDGFTSTEQNPVVTVAGNYILSVTVPNGCSSSASAEVIADTIGPDISIAQSGLLNCNTPCVNVQATSTTPGTIGFIQQYCVPGIYTATLIAPNGCTSSQSFEVIQTPPLQLETESAVDCEGLNTIGINVTGGTAPYIYEWSTGDTTAIINVISGTVDSVSVSITDADGCNVSSGPITLLPFSPIVADATVTNESAIGTQNGAVSLSVQGSDCVVYDYLWNTGDTTSSLVNLSAGVYTATVTCQLTGCTTVVTATVEVIVGTEDIAFWKKLTLSPNPTNGQALLTVQLPEATALRVKILDVTGRTVLNLPETTLLEGTLPLDLQHCPTGMYTVLLSTKNETAVRKLAVVRE